MAEYFYIRKDSVNPTLRIELINDGRFDFMKTNDFNNAIQNAKITFSMYDEDKVLKARGNAQIYLSSTDTCVERYIIEYKWKKRDTKVAGVYTGKFNIDFNGDLYEYGKTYPSGNLIAPIQEELKIMILE